MFSIRSFTDRILPALRLLVHQQRTVVSKSTRNKGTVWIGAHKDPLTPEQHQRMRRKHKPFVLGRDNVKRNFEPIRLTDASLAITKDQVPYDVMRTKNGNLPVYTDYRNGRGRILTIVRRIDGSAEKLCADLQSFLPKENPAEVNPITNHVIIKGNVQRTVRYWLTGAGF